MKKFHLLALFGFICLQASASVSFFASFTDPGFKEGCPISNYIYVRGSGYSLNKKPYHWQANPPKGPTDWITDDPNETNINSHHMRGLDAGSKSWAATGGVYDSTHPAAPRTQLWHPLSEAGHNGHTFFFVDFAVVPSTSTRVDDTFGWAFKEPNGATLFQILFKPDGTNSRRTLEVWEYDRNGEGTKTPLTIICAEKYNLSIDINLAAWSYSGTLTSKTNACNFSGSITGRRAGNGSGKDFKETMSPAEDGSAKDPAPQVGSVAAVWSLNGPGVENYGDNYMVFTDYDVVPEPDGWGSRMPGNKGDQPPVILPPPQPVPVTSN